MRFLKNPKRLNLEQHIMKVLPPGTILQLMYLKNRLLHLNPGRFLEIGPGTGEISELLLQLGWVGKSIDLEPETVRRLQHRFQSEIKNGQYYLTNENFLVTSATEKFDLVISCMVMEHFDNFLEKKFIQKALSLLSNDGRMITIVPGSPSHWGIEDDVAGHYRRYTQQSIQKLMSQSGWEIRHIAGLTFPLSNILLPVSNFLVKKAEKSKLLLTSLEKTKASGKRKVKFKTYFPSLFGLVLNSYTLKPFFWLQKIFRNHKSSLVIYFEAAPSRK
jgi:SAM-dependent methyltransferase